MNAGKNNDKGNSRINEKSNPPINWGVIYFKKIGDV
jgi:hypothetical protein